LDHAIDLVIGLLLLLCTLVLEAVGFVDGVLGSLMTRMGIDPNAQIALLIGVSVILVVLVIRKLGVLFAALIIILLVLLLAHRVMPGLAVPQFNLPGQPGAPSGDTTHV
jgi:hypothetical protein